MGPAGFAAICLAAAALGWGVYSLLGRGVQDALASTTVNFMLATPLGLLVFVILPDRITAQGVTLAQLSVPVIAMAGGMVFLGEGLTLRFVVASLLILAGVGVSMRR